MLIKAAFATCLLVSRAVADRSTVELGVEKRDRPSTVILADGTYYKSGSISSTFKWQSSGILKAPKVCSTKYLITDCYSLYEDEAGMLETTTAPARKRQVVEIATLDQQLEEHALRFDEDLDAYFTAFPEQLPEGLTKRQVVQNCGGSGGSGGGGGGSGGGTTPPPPPSVPSPRQRIEFLSWPGSAPNSVWHYEWSSYMDPTVSTSSHFHHTWQILRRDACGGPVITLDVKAGVAVLSDLVRGCANCASVPLNQFAGRTIRHSMTITWGVNGKIAYTATDLRNSKTVISYNASGDMGSSASIKFGMYRAVYPGNSAVFSYVGDYVAKRLS